MNTFEYVPAKTVKEACDLLSQYGEKAKILGGGQSLVTLMKQDFVSPSYLIDIKGISDLDYIRYDETDGLRIGALTTHRSLEKSAVVQEKFAMLAQMEHTLASVPVRNWGTVGGNLAHADPASDLAPTLMALGAEVTLTGPNGERVVSLDDFFIDYFETALRPDEILTEIHVPNSGQGGGDGAHAGFRCGQELGNRGRQSRPCRPGIGFGANPHGSWCRSDLDRTKWRAGRQSGRFFHRLL